VGGGVGGVGGGDRVGGGDQIEELGVGEPLPPPHARLLHQRDVRRGATERRRAEPAEHASELAESSGARIHHPVKDAGVNRAMSSIPSCFSIPATFASMPSKPSLPSIWCSLSSNMSP